MTYLQFHLIFNLPLFLLLLFLLRNRWNQPRVLWLVVLVVIAFVATTPWDNWAVHQGIWGFDWGRTTPIEIPWNGVLWRLPAEEYAFFIIMTVLVGMMCLFFLPSPGQGGKTRESRP